MVTPQDLANDTVHLRNVINSLAEDIEHLNSRLGYYRDLLNDGIYADRKRRLTDKINDLVLELEQMTEHREAAPEWINKLVSLRESKVSEINELEAHIEYVRKSKQQAYASGAAGQRKTKSDEERYADFLKLIPAAVQMMLGSEKLKEMYDASKA